MRRLKFIFNSKFKRDKIEAIKTWAVALLGYGAVLHTWTADGLNGLDRKARKLLIRYIDRYRMRNPKRGKDKLYAPRKSGRNGLIL